jgi:RHH-type proline utilization regulon transcriptional repressor/proline dehydrogenase/delta 1-pyrroline-5-carboxylate dehydrogenase
MSDALQLLCALPDLGDPYADEAQAVARLLAGAPPADLRAAARQRALRLIGAVRGADAGWLSAQNLLATFPLNTPEGIALLRLAEALLRAPDADTQTWLIAEKLAAFRSAASGHDRGLAQRVLSAALKLAGHTAGDAELQAGDDASAMRAWLARTTLRPLVIEGIRRFGEQFVFAPTLQAAAARAARRPHARELYSYDMLGEGVRTAADAQRNFDAYAAAIGALGRGPRGDWRLRDGISVKLSAIHPRFETAQVARVLAELYPRLRELALAARDADINFAVDAEESERLVLQVALVERLLREPALADWPGLGLAVQSYLPRASLALEHLLAVAREARRPLAVRLVKGAYWDGEIKRAQELGVAGFPVYTHKWASDAAYATLAQRLFAADAPVHPQFATHNALTAATVLELAARHPDRRFEFQRLHGMGSPLYAAILAEQADVPVRVYAPVGEFRDLLAYLVRRLLENGANSSFVHLISDPSVAPESLVDDPFAAAGRWLAQPAPQPALRSGAHLFDDRRNARGLDLADAPVLLRLARHVGLPLAARAQPLLAHEPATSAAAQPVTNPARHRETVGHVVEASAAEAGAAVAAAAGAFPSWDATPVAARATLLRRCADAFESGHDDLVRLLVREAGKTLLDAHLEVREAVDFLRYYAAQAERLCAEQTLPGPVGESNRLRLAGRGVFACISPWNFPLAIFAGQIAAALVTGNTVVAKPAEQTPLVACEAVRRMHAAGVPRAVLQLLPGGGETVGAALVAAAGIAGVAFTGSTATARAINRTLAARDGPIGVLIAETGGQNAMVVDSTALPEQVSDAVVASAFRSCGQRCSALRVLFLQREIADDVLAMIAGQMRELRIGDPADPATDVGPVIDAAQLAALAAHRDWLRARARRIHECELPPGLEGHFFAPVAYEIESIAQLAQEHFGPILHVVRFDRQRFDAVIDAINATGYGLTCGLHTRLDARVAQVAARIRAGNLYVNRNMIGAVVGVQPFGGEGLSGTGPKAGGPHYLLRFCVERTVTINTAAAGGNVELAAAPPG